MPRSVIVLGSDPDLFERVRTALREDSRFVDVGDGIHCDGVKAPLTNIYPILTSQAEWTDWDVDATGITEPHRMSNLIFECSSAAWVAEAGRLLTRSLEAPLWFVDAAERAWPAERVDLALLRLS
ncbi:hypothetical protein [Nocardioides sp. 503]|uniref:hypothetical protein n=1 Tax=Nocardioides sp. 503 TaxID=2508326 RepID=UPI00106F63AC|nr:hypothetical protein [Nocardioides sp. 503]